MSWGCAIASQRVNMSAPGEFDQDLSRRSILNEARSAPGGSYTLPPPINGTNTDASQQNRGGSGSDSSNPNGPLGPQGPTPNSTQTAPTQPGIVSYCNAFTTAPANGTCYDFTLEHHITLEEFTTWNPVLGYPDGHNCSTQFWTGYDYCKLLPYDRISFAKH